MSTATSGSLRHASTITTNPQLKRKRDITRPDCRHEYAEPFTLDRFVSRSERLYLHFNAICLFPWSKLAFSMLDPTDNDLIEHEGRVPMLEGSSKERRVVVIAQDQDTHRLYALESHDGRTHKYTPCRIRSDWSSTSRIFREHAIVWYSSIADSRKAPRMQSVSAYSPPRMIKQEGDTAHRRISSLTQPFMTASRPSSAGKALDKRTASSLAQSMPVASRPTTPTGDVPLPAVEETILPEMSTCVDEQSFDVIDQGPLPIESHSLGDPASATIDAEPADKCMDDILKELNKQYLDAVYLSRTSVAYFVKGPLSRARVTAADSASELAAFLRELLLSTSTTEKRLKETLPEIVKSLSDRADGTDKEQKKTRRSKWKAKRDRSGLLYEEKQAVEQWWQLLEEADTSSAPLTVVEQAGPRLQSLRKRETYLQIAVLLEVMSLEESMPRQMSSGTPVADPSMKRSKKEIDLASHLETLLDRLTIWHSIDFTSPEKKADTGNEDIESKDELRSFCIEVIVPFYMSRLPKTAALVNKRLGGPKTTSPLRRTASTSKRPGQPAERGLSFEKKHRKPLQRVATDSMLQSRKPTPSLDRSATDSQVQQDRHRREHSQSVSANSGTGARAGSQRPRLDPLASLSRRQIDLTAASSANETKLRKKAEQEAKVKEAIASIKRPDRALALKENAAVVDANFRQSLQRSKKSSSNIHIAATPNASRYIAATPRKTGDDSTQPYGTAYLAPPQLLPPALSAIPQTGHRERTINMITPSLQDDSTEYPFPASLHETPLLHRSSKIDLTPSKPPGLMLLQETPIVKRSIEIKPHVVLIEQDPNITCTTTPPREESVYDALGWDNEEYEELA